MLTPWKKSYDQPRQHIKKQRLEKEMATHSSILAWRIINNLRYADDTTLMAESEEELKRLLIKVKEESEKLA